MRWRLCILETAPPRAGSAVCVAIGCDAFQGSQSVMLVLHMVPVSSKCGSVGVLAVLQQAICVVNLSDVVVI
jgi:hypothetical protein